MKVKLSFEEWMVEVNKQIDRKCGMVADDLPDWRYREAYNAGKKPEVAAYQAIKAARSSY
jgi:hypothetical protein